MDQLFEKRNTQWAALFFLTAHGGRGMLQPAMFARALRSSVAMVSSEFAVLEKTGKIRKVKGAATLWEIVDFDKSRFSQAAPTKTSQEPPHSTKEATPAKVVILTPEYWGEPAKLAHNLVREYHSTIRTGGPFGPAISAVEARLKEGWTKDRLRSVITAYRDHVGSDKTYARNAYNFFKLEDGVWFGEQFEQTAAPQKQAAPQSISELADKMRAAR